MMKRTVMVKFKCACCDATAEIEVELQEHMKKDEGTGRCYIPAAALPPGWGKISYWQQGCAECAERYVGKKF